MMKFSVCWKVFRRQRVLCFKIEPPASGLSSRRAMASTIPNGARRLAKQSRGSASSAVDGPEDAGGHPASNHVPFGGLCSGYQNRDGISGSGMRSEIL
jgi:hypothetical protein